MKNFKAKEWLEKENVLIDYSIKTDDICYCCKEKKTPRIPIYIDEYGEDKYDYGEVDYKYVCLDCLQYEPNKHAFQGFNDEYSSCYMCGKENIEFTNIEIDNKLKSVCGECLKKELKGEEI